MGAKFTGGLEMEMAAREIDETFSGPKRPCSYMKYANIYQCDADSEQRIQGQHGKASNIKYRRANFQFAESYMHEAFVQVASQRSDR
jgi:hypothetical protein